MKFKYKMKLVKCKILKILGTYMFYDSNSSNNLCVHHFTTLFYKTGIIYRSFIFSSTELTA